MMVVASVGGFGGLGGFKVVLQTGKGLLRGGEIAGFQSAGQILVIRVRLAVFAKGLAGGGLRIGRRVALQGLLKAGQGTLRRGDVARLQGAADGLETFDDLGKAVLVGGLDGIIGRIYTGDVAHTVCLC